LRSAEKRSEDERPPDHCEPGDRALRPPDVMIYLRCSALARIEMRGRKESSPPARLLARLDHSMRAGLSATICLKFIRPSMDASRTVDRIGLYERIESALR
jgi:hypothetical protein